MTRCSPLTGMQAELRHCPTTAAASKRFPLAHPVLFQATGFADHPYGQGASRPTRSPPTSPTTPTWRSSPSSRARSTGSWTSTAPAGVFPIYSTEFGYQTNPPELGAISTDPQTAAYYLNWSEYISWRNPRVVSYDQYLLVRSRAGQRIKGFATGLCSPTGVPRASYFAYRMPIYLPVRTFKHGQALEVWGCVRPARFARLATRIEAARGDPVPGCLGVGRSRSIRTIALNGRYFDTNVNFDVERDRTAGLELPRRSDDP